MAHLQKINVVSIRHHPRIKHSLLHFSTARPPVVVRLVTSRVKLEIAQSDQKRDAAGILIEVSGLVTWVEIEVMPVARGVASHGDTSYLDLILQTDALNVTEVDSVPHKVRLVSILNKIVVRISNGYDVLRVDLFSVPVQRQALVKRFANADATLAESRESTDVIRVVVRREHEVDRVDRGDTVDRTLADKSLSATGWSATNLTRIAEPPSDFGESQLASCSNRLQQSHAAN
jgi:hypothetical protein